MSDSDHVRRAAFGLLTNSLPGMLKSGREINNLLPPQTRETEDE
jgi:hypothetical protein